MGGEASLEGKLPRMSMTCGLHGMTGRTFACMEEASASSKIFVYFTVFSLHNHLPYSHI